MSETDQLVHPSGDAEEEQNKPHQEHEWTWPSRKATLLLTMLVWNVTLGGGLLLGLQGIYGQLEDRGFCSDRCPLNISNIVGNKTTTDVPSGGGGGGGGGNTFELCTAQKTCLAQTVNLMCSVLNAGALPSGLLVDVIGKWAAWFFGTVVSLVAWNMYPIEHESATGLRIASPFATAGLGLAFFGSLHLLMSASPAHAGTFISIFTAFWDLAIAFTPLIGLLLQNESLTLHQVFGIVTCWTIIPVVVLVGLWMSGFPSPPSPPPPQEEEEHAVIQQKEEEETAPGGYNTIKDDVANDDASASGPSSPAVADAKRLFTSREFWGLLAGATSTVTYGFYALANVGLIVSSHGATDGETHDFEKYGAVMMGVLGATVGFLVGAPIDKAGAAWPRMSAQFALLQAFLLGVVLVMVQIESIPWGAQYFTWAVIVVWRMLGFTGINVSWSKFVARDDLGRVSGVGMGSLYCVAGVVSIAIGRFATKESHEGDFLTVHAAMCAPCIVLHLIQAFCVWK